MEKGERSLRQTAMYEIDEKSIKSMKRIIEHFLQRQKLVALAMLDVHPTALRLAGTHILGIEIEPYVTKWQDKLDADMDFARNWQSGLWRGTWKHWAHGVGCRLTHIESGEPIEWDAPNLLAFDEGWFGNHLGWRIQQTVPSNKVEPYSHWLWSIYQYMRDQQIIVLNSDYKGQLK
jgi:hypothetical protein